MASVMSKTQNSIFLDFGDRCQLGGKNRRSSFLPECLGYSEQQEDLRKSENKSDPENKRKSEDVFPMGAQAKQKDESAKEHLIQEFCTGSKYIGECNRLGIAGKGIYKYPHGVMYKGNFNKNGEFHGSGTLIYPGGQKVEGVWKNGKIMEGSTCINNDNVSYGPHQYCRMPDRRFEIEVLNEFNPAGQEYLTNEPNPPKQIPKGCYDTGEGFYDPVEKVIYDYRNLSTFRTLDDFGTTEDEKQFREEVIDWLKKTKMQKKEERVFAKGNILSVPLRIKDEWITEHCRKEWDEPTGFRPDMYELWTSGQQKEDDISIESNDEEDKAIDKLVELSIASATPSSFGGYSFIRIADSFIYPIQSPIEKEEKLSIVKKTPSLLAVSKMFLPKMASTELVKNQLVKRICIYTALKRVSAKLSNKFF